MKKKRKLGRMLLSFLLTLAMVVGLVPGMGLTVYAATALPADGSETGSGDVYFVGFTAGSESGDYTSPSGVSGSNMFDGKADNKACIGFTGSYSIEFSYSKPIIPTKYYFRTGNDTSGYTKRNPSAWKLEGKKSDETWTELDSKSGQTYSTDNYTATAFSISNTEEYQFFRLTITGINDSGTDDYPINGKPTFQLSEVYMSGSLKPSGYSVTLTGGANAATSGGATSQTGLTDAMTTVTYTANEGYHFADFTDITNNGITATRTSDTVVTVSGTPNADATIKVPDAVEKTAATVTKAPAAKTLTYTGSAQALVTAGEAADGAMQYALGTKDAATEEYTTSIPKATAAGMYYVWYKVIGDKNHLDTEAEPIEVKIDKAKGAFPKPANISLWNSDMACVDAVDGQEYVIVEKGGEPDWTKAVTGDEDGTVIFEGLQPCTEYDIYTRVKETENEYAGEAVSTAFLTDLVGFSVEGDTYVGETLTITTDPEDAEGLSYKWYYVNIVEEDEGYRRTELGDAIEGAEGATYTLTEDDYGKYVCVVIYRGDKEYDRSSEYGPVEYDPEKISYRNTKGAGGEWTKGSSDSLQMTFKRSVVDSETFSHFTGIRVDGKAVDASDYTAEAGSVIIKLNPSYLETLTVGEHVLTAQFDDADDAKADFTVKEAETSEDTEDTGKEDETTEDVTTEDPGKDNDKTSEEVDEPAKDADIKPADTQADTEKTADEKIDSPKTGDETNPQLMLLIMLFAAVDMALVAFIKSKKKNNR